MAYAAPQDLIDRYTERDLAQLTDPDGLVIDQVVLTRALEDAAAEIDSYLQGRYALPIPNPPKVLALLACDIAVYRLQSLRPMQGIEDARKRYEDAVKFLLRIAKGEDAGLGLDTAGQRPAETGAAIVSGPGRMFSRDSLRGL